MAKVYMLWHGGSSYAVADQFNRSHIETFASMAEAKRAFDSRPRDRYYPAVERCTPDQGGPEAWICDQDPFEIPDLYPDWIISFGPRGGVRVEAA